jgi:hypothetical protein
MNAVTTSGKAAILGLRLPQLAPAATADRHHPGRPQALFKLVLARALVLVVEASAARAISQP